MIIMDSKLIIQKSRTVAQDRLLTSAVWCVCARVCVVLRVAMDVISADTKTTAYEINSVPIDIVSPEPEPEVNLRKQPRKPKSKLERQATRYSLDSNPPQFYDKGLRGGAWYDKILLDRRIRFGVVFLLFAVIIPLIVYWTVFTGEDRTDPYNIPGSCIIKAEYRVPCLPGSSPSQQQCSIIGCCWNTSTTECYHSAPSSYQYLNPDSDPLETAPEIHLKLTPRLDTTVFGTPAVKVLKVDIVALADDHLQIMMTDSKQSSVANGSRTIQESQFNVTVYQPGFFLDVSRRNRSGGDQMLLSTAHGPLIAGDNYWEVSLQLPTDSQVFGLGRLLLSSKEDNPKTMYNHPRNTGTHPVVFCIDEKGRTHGVYLQHHGPLEIHFYEESNLLSVRSVSTEGFNIHVLAGPRPRDVVTQLTALVGRPAMPPYWGLGLHVCVDTTDSSSDVTNGTVIAEGWSNFSAAAAEMGLPYDSHCLHERLLVDLRLRVAVDQEDVIKEALEQLRAENRRFLLSIPPALEVTNDSDAYVTALAKSTLIKTSLTNSSPYVGELWERNVSYPDWSHSEAQPWFQAQLQSLQGQLGVVAGVVLQDNWPKDETIHPLEKLPYLPQAMNGSLSNGTVWWQAAQSDGPHYTTHNSYGFQQSRVIRDSLSGGPEPLVLSASTAVGSGSVSGSHHQGAAQVPALWASLKQAMSYVLGSGLVGLPLASGGPVCGNMEDFDPKEDEALCLKWYLLSSTLPLMRVSSVYPYRDPPSLFSGYARQAALQAVQLRYSLLPYFYTLFHEASQSGAPVARPMFFEFPEDSRSFARDEQFLLGASLMVAPVIVPSAIRVAVYLPDVNITWYEFQGGRAVNNGTGGKFITLDNWETEIMMLLRGGYIIPTQAAALTADESRLNPLSLTVGLHCPEAEQCNATGHLYLDRDDQNTTLLIEADYTRLSVANLQEARFLCPVSGTALNVSTVVDELRVFGVNTTHAQIAVSVNGQPHNNVTVDYRERDLTLRLGGLALDWCQFSDDQLVISWL